MCVCVCVCVCMGGNLEGPKAMHKQHSEMAGHDLDQKLSPCLYNQISCLDGKMATIYTVHPGIYG